MSQSALETVADQRGLIDAANMVMVRLLAWAVFHQVKDQSYKGKVLGVRYSIKVKKLEPMWVQWFGPDPEAPEAPEPAPKRRR